ncbi:hypothetical protein RDI58_011748 [Solanum bulbocastanum]|uniref:Uncharacterized protein n=1 Tax=Solanum bulbocastanum TaxID=147425 RepID=A0AAN8TXF9_SOLBU
MNISGSECSSGCESGWTMYFDQFSADQYNNRRDIRHNNNPYGFNYKTEYVSNEDQEEDEDMSMVSDASSGPPHFHEDYCFDENGYIFYPSASPNIKKAKEKRKINEQKVKKQSLYLDDTASSPFSNFPKDERCYNDRTSMEMVTGFSETHSKGKSVLGKHFGFLKTSVSGRTSSEKSSGLKGRKRQ